MAEEQISPQTEVATNASEPVDSRSKVEALINKILSIYSEGKIIQAERKVRKIENLVATLTGADAEAVGELMKKHEQTFKSILIEAREIRVLLAEFSVDEGWDRIEEDGNGGRTSFKSNPGSSIQTLRIDAIADTSFFNVLAILFVQCVPKFIGPSPWAPAHRVPRSRRMEVDMFNLWVPCTLGLGLTSCMEVATLSRLRKIAYFTAGLPWPISDRDVCVYGYGADLLDVDGSVVAVLRSPDVRPVIDSAHVLASDHGSPLNPPSKKHKKKAAKPVPAPVANPDAAASEVVALSLEEILDPETKAKLPPLAKKFVRTEMRIGGFKLTPVDKDTTKICLLWHVDPKLDLIPTALVNWGLKHVALFAVSLLKQHSKAIEVDEKSPYIKRMEEKPDLYDFLRKRFNSWLESATKSEQTATSATKPSSAASETSSPSAPSSSQ